MFDFMGFVLRVLYLEKQIKKHIPVKLGVVNAECRGSIENPKNL